MDGNGQQPQIDLSAASAEIASEDGGQIVHLRDRKHDLCYYTAADGSTKPQTIMIAGTYSGVYRRAKHRHQRTLIKLSRGGKPDPAELDRAQIELIADCVLGWEGIVARPGELLPFTRPNVVQILTHLPWVRDQLEEAQSDHEGFSTSSSGSSS
jgi:hypothetical protein